MRTAAILALNLSSKSVRESLQSVLAPDNEGAPRGTTFTMVGDGSALEFRVSSDSAPAVMSTMLALLRDITLFQEVWLLSHGMGPRVQRRRTG